MAGKWKLVLGMFIGVIISLIALVVYTVYSFTNSLNEPGSWEHTTLSMSVPECTFILNSRVKSFRPPTEYEYSGTLYYGKQSMDFDLSDDTSGHDPVIVHALEAITQTRDTLDLLLLFIFPGSATLLDPQNSRIYSTILPTADLNGTYGINIAVEGASEDWEEELVMIRWRYVATIGNTRIGRWGVSLNSGIE